MESCVRCRKWIWPWQSAYSNGFWHQVCYDIWKDGYETASNFCSLENQLMGIDSPFMLYYKRILRDLP